jgi:hypothetical protein
MTTISVSLTDDRMEKLKQAAARFGISPEDLLRFGVEDLLSRPGEEFLRVVEYVLAKNSEIHRRLA